MLNVVINYPAAYIDIGDTLCAFSAEVEGMVSGTA